MKTARIKAAFDLWWLAQSAKGDPQRNPKLVADAFAAGFSAGELSRDKEAREDARSTAIEARWQATQGEDYGSF